ncbi:MAG: lipid A export permease/ATP-binding protein MsbA [Aquabacterium sp.]|nr:MAG: lipid A export permease/ATP-binding protein MsbA [Aquabacterium sp.]
MNLRESGRVLAAYAKPRWRMLSLSILFFVLGSAVEPLLPALFKKLLDSGFQEGLKYPIWVVPLIIIGMFVVRGGFNFSGAYMLNSASSLVVLDLRRDLMKAVLRADAKLFTHMSPGIAVTRIINDPQFAAGAVGGALTTLLRDATTLLFLMGYLVYLNWQLTLVSMVTAPLLAFAVRTIQKRLKHVGEASYLSHQRLVNIVDDNARAWRVVRTFDAMDFESQRFEAEATVQRRMQLKHAAAAALATPTTQLVASIGVAIIVTLALWQASHGAATVGEFVSFITALLMAMSPMRHLTDVYQPITQAMIVMQGCRDLIDAPKEPDLGTREIATCRGEIEFDRVLLTYEGAPRPSLDGLDLHIRPGETVALVGASGAGKTTVVSALLRFAVPEGGEIRLDGVPINDLKLANLRRHFAVVSQDIVLFDGSIEQNVAYASGEVDRAKVESCLRAANLMAHVQTLPEGIDTPIGTNGSKFSGGQRQRLAIARALYRDAAVWIFDEATSALDSESEAVVQRSIEDMRHTKTLILIAHRLSTVRNADRIYAMSDGRVVESGSHEELIESGGVYASMVRLQSAG